MAYHLTRFFQSCCAFGCKTILLMLWVLVWVLAPQVTWATQHPYFSKHPEALKKLEQMVSAAQMQALEMQPADLSIALKDLEGQDYPLERHRGQVLLLTRWATWCGACKSEMPYKLRLHNQIQDKRFQVIGISDESRDTVSDYQKSTSSVYPVSLIDSQGIMTKFFPGGAIPVTILVDGWGWLIAMKRGGAPWNQPAYEVFIRYLISLSPTPEQLKEKAPAPEVRFPASVQVTPGQTFSLVFSVRWIGESDKYTRIAFRLPQEKGLQRLGMKVSGVQEGDGQNLRKYMLRMKALQIGTYQLQPVLMNYWLKDYDQHFQVKAGNMTIQVVSPDRLRPNQKYWPFVVVGAAMFLFVLLLFLLRSQKRALLPPSEEEVARKQREQMLQELLSQLVEAHQGSDAKQQIDSMYQLCRKMMERVPDNITSWRDDIRYGGKEFPPEERRQLLAQLATTLQPEFPEAAKRIKSL